MVSIMPVGREFGPLLHNGRRQIPQDVFDTLFYSTIPDIVALLHVKLEATGILVAALAEGALGGQFINDNCIEGEWRGAWLN